MNDPLKKIPGFVMAGDIAEKLHASRYWKFRKYLQQNPFLADWLRRELQAVMQVFVLYSFISCTMLLLQSHDY